MNEQYVYLHESVHKDQLRALLKDCGYVTAPDTFRALGAGSSGRYSDTVIRVSGGVAVCLSPDDAAQRIRQAAVVPLHDVLGQHVLSDVSITDNNNQALLWARVHGQTILSRAVNRPLYEVSFQKTPKSLA